MMKAHEKLRKFLAKLLVFPSRDSDLGGHCIMAAKSQEISDFIESGLDDEIRACLPARESASREMKFPIFQEEVCRHVYIFFRQYYPHGDAYAKRMPASKTGLMPRNGQDVGLQWANHDHYYVKSDRKNPDYFIHKDLGGFLTRELDDYIKNEMLHPQDLVRVQSEWNVSRVKAVVQIARKIIAYLADAEEVRKKLWLKKKFVVETNYCLTLDRIPKHYYPEIVANNDQREEWARLLAIDETKEPAEYSVPLTMEFLNSHPFLMVDTKFFGEAFKEKLIGEVQDLSDACNGVIICGEASQALRLIRNRYQKQIDTVVIDPPYNTGSNGFGYKDKLRHSSWLTMMADCLSVCPEFLKGDGIFAATIDDNELHHLGLLLNVVFGENKRVACAPWLSEPSRGKEKTGLRTGHEYVLIYHNGDPSSISQDERPTGKLNLHDKFGPYRKGRELRKWGGISSRRDRPNQWYALKAPDGEEVYPIKNDGSEGHWRWGKDNESVKAALEDPEIFHWEKCAFDKEVTYLGVSKRWVPFEKIRSTRKPVGWSAWLDAHGSNADGTRELKNLFGKKVFGTPKPTQLYRWIVSLHSDRRGHVLDFFAGSGTTAHAIIDLNREDGGNRKYVLVEMEDYFDAVLKTRIQKVVYSKDWKGGKPSSRESGVSHVFEYLRIESYEDCVSRLIACFSRSKNDPEATESDQGQRIDLVETFNFLIGLTASVMTPWAGFSAEFQRDSNGSLAVSDFRADPEGPWRFRSVIGTTQDGNHALVIWRSLTNREEEDDLVLNQWFALQNYASEICDARLIYVHGKNNLKSLKRTGDAWEVRTVEEEFQRLVWDQGKM